MSHNFDAHDAMATARIERNAIPLLLTAFEGGDWRQVRAPRIDRRQPIHSLTFSDGRQWDEHNGWRNSSVPARSMKSYV